MIVSNNRDMRILALQRENATLCLQLSNVQNDYTEATIANVHTVKKLRAELKESREALERLRECVKTVSTSDYMEIGDARAALHKEAGL